MEARTARHISFPTVALAALTLAGCDSNPVPPPADHGVDRAKIDVPRPEPDFPAIDQQRPDTRPPDRLARELSSFDGGVPFKDFVFDQLLVPTNNTDAQKYAFVWNGKTYNALGTVLALVASQVATLAVQEGMDLSVSRGDLLELLRVQAASFVSGPALAKLWRGKAQACCTAVTDVVQCKAQAKAGCFDGSHTFAPVAPTPAQAAGSITGGQMSFGPAQLKLDLVLATLPMTLTLDSAQLKGTLGASAITDGVLAGAVPIQEINTVLIPSLASLMTSVLQDPLVTQATKDQISVLFDVNKDGTVTAAELLANGIISTILSGDVDLDGDKTADHMSVGLGYTAVGAVITP